MAAQATNNGDVFTKWIVGIAGTAVVAVGGMLFSSMTSLREDVAVIKSEMVGAKSMIEKVGQHEIRINTLEQRESWRDNPRPRYGNRTWYNTNRDAAQSRDDR